MDIVDMAWTTHDNYVEGVACRIRAILAEKGDNICHQCGNKIPFPRRLALPSASICRDCKQKQES